MSDDLLKRARAFCIHTPLSKPVITKLADHIDDLEAKLAKAVEALEEAIYLLDPEEEDIAKETGIYRVVTTCKELKGEDQ